jgi:hypothetical protein
MELLSNFDQSMVKCESPGFAMRNDLPIANGNVCLIRTPLGCSSISFLSNRRRRRQQTQFSPKPIDLCQFKTTHSDPLPSLRDSHQGGKDQLQTTLFIKETRNHLRPPLLLRGHVRSGELRALAIEGLAKEYFPGAATFEELGYELGVGGSFGIAAPKGTSADIVKKLHDSFKKAIEDPRYEATCKKVGAFKAYMSGEEVFKRIRKEYELRGKILKELGLEKNNSLPL